MEKMKQFDIIKDRDDEFYKNVFSDVPHFPELEEVVKLCVPWKCKSGIGLFDK